MLADESGRVAQILGLVLEGTADTRDPVVTHETVKGWLANPTRLYDKANNRLKDEAAWIPAFGNVSDPDILSDDLPPNGSNGSIRITSRDSLEKTPLCQVRVGINPPPMIEQEASELFLKLTWRESDVEEERNSAFVAEVLGGMPLALTQVAGVIIRQSLSVSDFFKSYKKEAHDTLFERPRKPNHKHTNYGHTIASVRALEGLNLLITTRGKFLD
ncbi:hypothetical protein F5X98DRAFT_389581 [Xylaria grammica]|nr:hypothetical protein F5X98DRAFT_389581 [Xylaria grammica]